MRSDPVSVNKRHCFCNKIQQLTGNTLIINAGKFVACRQTDESVCIGRKNIARRTFIPQSVQHGNNIPAAGVFLKIGV